MKKILSLLSMLMITVTAFATSYTDKLTYKLTVFTALTKDLPAGELTIEPYGTSNYTVTAKGCDLSDFDAGNWDEIVCEDVAGTKDANGVTTITLDNPYAYRTSDNTAFTDTKLVVKFNGTKAYAHFEGKMKVMYVARAFEYTFGTDEGFDGGSTGGGETGGETKEKYTVNFDKTAYSTHSGRVLNSFSLQQTGKEKQTESVSASRAAYEDHTAKKFTVEAGSEVTASFNYTGEWMNGYVYIDRDNDGEFSYNKGLWNQEGTDLVAYSFYTTLDDPKTNDGNGYNSTGASVTGNARSNVNPPAFTAPTEPGTYRIRFKVDWNCILPGGSNDILSDGGGVWDATLEVVAPAPTVAETFTYDQDAFVGPNDTKGTANVKVYKMTDDSYTMEITAPVATKVGVITVSEDAKGRTTYMGEVESSVVDGVKYVVNGVVYEEGGAKHLYMTLTHDDDTYTIGENPDAPKVKSTLSFENVAYTTSYNGQGTANVTFTEMSDATFPMTFVSDGLNVYAENLTKGEDAKGRTTYTGTAKRTDVDVTFTVKAVVYGEPAAQKLYMTMDNGAGFVVTVGENPDVVTPEVTEVSNKTYTSNLRILDGETTVVEEAEANVNIIKYSDESYKVTLKNVNMLNKTQDLVFVGKVITDVTDSEAPLTIMAKSDEATTNVFGEQVSGTFEITEVSADEIKMGFSMESQNFSYQGEFNYTEEEEPEVYTNNLHIYDAAAPETDLFQADQAKVEFLATETGEFKLTLKDVTLNEKTQDLVFTGALPTPQPGGQDPLAEEGETTPAEPAMVLNATADEATATFLGATSATAVFNVSYDKNDNFMMTFTIAAAAGKNYAGEFNYVKKTPDTPDPELFCKENYVADGEGFEWEIAVDWDTQKIVMSIDPSTCTGSCEDVIGLGAVPTAWDNTLHLYRTSADQMLQGYFNVPGGSNNNTDKFAETAPFLVEVSKAQGFVVNNEVKIAASAMSYLFTLPTVKMGTGEGANDKSRATYNYVKVVDKDWTAPKDPDTGINATTVAEGEVEFFTVNGVKLNKLQKGLNIVRTADGKVKKVLVK